MTLNRIDVSKIVHYYYNDEQIFNLLNVLGHPDSIIFNEDLTVVLTINNNRDTTEIFHLLWSILHYSSKTTIGDKYVYEYDLGVDYIQGDTEFTIGTDYSTYIVELSNVYYDSNRNLEIVFKRK